MVATLFYQESPLIAIPLTLAVPIAYRYGYFKVCVALAVLLIFFLFFYRYYEVVLNSPDCCVECPADGEVAGLKSTGTHLALAIYLSPMNIHTQIYPVNGTVISRVYDESGKFNLAFDLDKSAENEKKIHYLSMDMDGTAVSVTQIAGFLPRRIASSDQAPMKVRAGDYLGMIKFGSRVDMLIPLTSVSGRGFMLADGVAVGKRVLIGDRLGSYY